MNADPPQPRPSLTLPDRLRSCLRAAVALSLALSWLGPKPSLAQVAPPGQPAAAPAAPLCERRCPSAERDKAGCCSPCPEGQTRTKQTQGRCCWPEQSWANAQAQCLGVPRCPEGMTLQRGACVGHQTSPEKREDIRALLRLTGATRQAQRALDQLIQSYQSLLPQVPDPFWRALREQLDEQAIVELMVPAYDKHLSHDEIKALLAFYRSDAGQKYVRVMPDLQRETRQSGQRWGLRMAQTIEAKLKAEGYDTASPTPPTPTPTPSSSPAQTAPEPRD